MMKKREVVVNDYEIPQVLDKLTLIKALSHFSEHYDKKRFKPWVVSYMNERPNLYNNVQVNAIRTVNDSFFTTIGSVCRLVATGKQLPAQYNENYIQNKLLSLLKFASVEKSKDEPKPVVVDAKYSDDADQLLFSIDEKIDNFIKTRKLDVEIWPEFSSANSLVLNALGCMKIEEWKSEVSRLIASKYMGDGMDEYQTQMCEAYSNFNPKEKQILISFYNLLIEHVVKNTTDEKLKKAKEVLDLIAPTKAPTKKQVTPVAVTPTKSVETPEVQKKPRKPRKNKMAKVNTDRLLKTFVHKDEYEGIKSTKAKDLIGATEIYLYDTQYNRLIRLVATQGQTLSVKGKTIINLDEKVSGFKRITQKHLKATLASFSGGTKASMARNFSGLKNSFNPHTGRVSAETLILRVY